MGQAKARGTREQRVAEALEKKRLEEVRNAEIKEVNRLARAERMKQYREEKEREAAKNNLIEVTMNIELINIINELEKRISILEHRLDTGLRELPPDHVDYIPTIPGNATVPGLKATELKLHDGSIETLSSLDPVSTPGLKATLVKMTKTSIHRKPSSSPK